MEKLLVIGGLSFSGADFIRHILTLNRFEVYVQARTFKPAPFIPFDPRQVKFIYCDLNKNYEGFFNSVEQIKPDYIINFAAQSEVPWSWDNPDQWYQTNTVFVAKLAKFLSGKSWLKKYLHISTPEVYGSVEQAVMEDQYPNPSTPYAASKLAGDMCLQLFHKQFGLPVLFIRSANVVGPGQQLWKIVCRSILYMLEGKKVPLHGGGTSSRLFTDIRDVSAAEMLLLDQGVIGDIYHIANHELTSVADIASISFLELKARGKISGFLDDHVETVSQRPGNDKAYVLNCDKIKALGWKAEITIRRSISDTVDWILSNYEELKKLPKEYIHKP